MSNHNLAPNYNDEETKEILNTIVKQLCGGGQGRLKIMIGAYNFAYNYDTDNNLCLSFRWKAKAANKANYVKITLDIARDLYNIEFGRIHGMTYLVKGTFEGYYADMLMDCFQTETQFNLSL